MKKQPYAVLLLLFVLFPGVGATQNPPEYMRLWGEANAPYKRALQATSMGQIVEAGRFLGMFRQAWRRFVTAYESDPPIPFQSDRHWPADLRAVTGWIGKADREIAAGEVQAAHETLELVRRRWMEMRARRGVSTLGDHLTRYHDPMEKMTLIVKDRTAATLTETDIATIRAALPELERCWWPVSKIARSLRKTLGSNGSDIDDILPIVEAEEAALQTLKRAVEKNDREGIVTHGRELKPNFARLYMQFG